MERAPGKRAGARPRRRTRWAPLATGILAATVASACARVSPPPLTAPAVAGWSDDTVASWYGDPFHGRLTASGEVYDMEEMTAAHRTLPFDTVLRVLNLDNGRETTVRINDRGPFVRGRNIDLSRRAARELDMIGPGTARVRLTILDAPDAPSCWEVQVGAFAVRENAEATANRLDSGGHPVRVVRHPDGLHRVRVGPMDSRSDAESIADRAEGILLGCPVPA